MRPSAPVLAVLLCVACAPAVDPGNGDAGTQPGEANPTYYGLVDDRCLLFSDDYSIHVEANDVAITGKSVFTLTHNKLGFRLQVDYVEPTAEGLRLHRRDEYVLGQPNDVTVWRFTDAPLFLTEELAPGSPLETTTSTLYEQPGTAQVTKTTVVKSEVLEALEVTAGGQTFNSQRLLFQVLEDDVAQRTDRLWFASNHGLVKIDPHGSDLKEVTFQSFKTLDPTSSGTQRFCIHD